MKTIAFWAAILALVCVSSCTFTNLVAKGNKSHVLFSSIRPTKATSPRGLINFKSLIAARNLGPKVKGVRSLHTYHGVRSVAARSTTVSRVRDLSASTDIASMTYTITALDGSMAPITDTIDPTWPYLDLYLDAGTWYRIVVDVALTPTGPGAAVGITRFGDQQDFYVDYGYDAYVDLFVHPTALPVFQEQAIYQSGPGYSVKYYQPSVSAALQTQSTGITLPSPQDKVFFSSDGSLYYFNYANNSVYQWTNISTTLLTGAAFINFNSLFASVQISAVCADPSYPGWFYAVGEDTAATKFYYFLIDTTGGSPVAYQGPDITSDLNYPTLTSPTIVPTGISTDDTGDVFVSYYYYNASTAPSSTVIDYYNDSFWAAITSANNGTDSMYTDVTWDQGQLWALASPITAPTWLYGTNANTGTADILTMDSSLGQTATIPVSLTQTYLLGSPTFTMPAGRLVLPNRFAGPIQGTILYISQYDFASVSTTTRDQLTSINIDTGAIVDH